MARQALSRPRLSPQGLAYSLSFDGVSDRAATVANAGFTGDDAISMIGTFKVTKLNVSTGAGLVVAGALTAPTPGAGPVIACIDGNQMQSPFIFGSNLNFYRFPVDEWVHVAVTYAGGTGGIFMVYINGTRIYTGAITGAAADGPIGVGGAYVSGLGGYIYQKLKVASFAVYTDVLTETEIQENYANKTYPTDNAVGIYCFNEGSGTTINDYSGNGNHLQVTNGAPIWSSTDIPVVARQTASARQIASNRQAVT